ncbi:MAG: hypothetical protein M1825_004555 [Sarcosagium campestre]|nr:MAG: hypothetical protein M1825_004555 [Sarcosagium campestre]
MPPGTQSASGAEKSPFEQQRDALVGEIAISMEHVLQNLNKLNRSLEGVIAVGNEFGSVEALWSQFEGVMGNHVPGEEGEEADDDDDYENNEDDEGDEDGRNTADDGENEEQDVTITEENAR